MKVDAVLAALIQDLIGAISFNFSAPIGIFVIVLSPLTYIFCKVKFK